MKDWENEQANLAKMEVEIFLRLKSRERVEAERAGTKHLIYRVLESPSGLPLEDMRDLGISYTHSTPRTVADCWYFWNCTGVPEPLPTHIETFRTDPMKLVGYGLSEEDAAEIMKG